MSERENAARWCSVCEAWTVHDARIDRNLATREEFETVLCARCGTVAERRKLALVELRTTDGRSTKPKKRERCTLVLAMRRLRV